MNTRPDQTVADEIETILAKLLIDPSYESTPDAREEAAREALTMKQAKAKLLALVQRAEKEALAKHVLAGMPELSVKQQEYITGILTAKVGKDEE